MILSLEMQKSSSRYLNNDFYIGIVSTFCQRCPALSERGQKIEKMEETPIEPNLHTEKLRKSSREMSNEKKFVATPSRKLQLHVLFMQCGLHNGRPNNKKRTENIFKIVGEASYIFAFKAHQLPAQLANFNHK